MNEILFKIYIPINIFIIILISTIICDINIHLIPHTHLDPGWLYTAEEYYNMESINDIFCTVIHQLYDDPKKEKTFVINEMFYFKRWYEETNPDNYMKIKQLVEEKRLEFVSGSFVANDEATPSYNDIIDQIRIGQQFLEEELNITSKTAWYIDSFGHSAGNAYLMTEFDYENIVLGRMHLDHLELLKKEKNMEFYWQPFDNFISNKTIFTHILPFHYGFTLHQKELGDKNVTFCKEAKNHLLTLLKHIKDSYTGLRHKNILFLYGDDYTFQDINLFSNIDCLLEAFNNLEDKKLQQKIKKIFDTNENIKLFYSTPERYFNSVKKELIINNEKLEIFKNIDFYPLKTDCFWTGYFTSRPYLKGYIRKASNIYYSISKYLSMLRLTNYTFVRNEENNTMPNIKFFREMVSLTQHHKAITGTCKQYVSEDYTSNLRNIIRGVENNFKENIENKLNIKIGNICYNNYLVEQKLCSSDFMITNNANNEIKIGLYNPLIASSQISNNLLINIEIFTSYTYYEIEGIKSDFFCIHDKNLKSDDIFKYKNKCFLNFFYEFKKGEEITYITLKKLAKNEKTNTYYILNNIKNEEKIELIKNNTYIKSLIFYPNNFEFNLEYYDEPEIKNINFTYYDGIYYGNADTCSDGAFQFSPYNKYPEKIDIDYKNSFYFIGNLGTFFVTRNIEASFTFFIIFNEPFFIKVEHFFDSIEESYFLNRFSFGYAFVLKTNINNKNEYNKPTFYTDLNGLEMMKRKIDKFNYVETANNSIAGNFYPVTSSISIKDENNNKDRIVTIFNDRPQAGTGILLGSIILIIQRMSNGNDNKGLTENLWEKESMNNNHFKTTHFILFGLNFNNNNNKNSNKAILEYKTDLLNFIYNYFNTAILMFKIEDTGVNFEKKLYENNILLYNLFDKHIKTSPDIRVYYQLILKNLIIGEFFRYSNNFFNINHKKEINAGEELNYGKIDLNFNDNDKVNFKIYYDEYGIDYNRNETYIFNPEQEEKFMLPKNLTLSLGYDEFLFIYFYIDDN